MTVMKAYRWRKKFTAAEIRKMQMGLEKSVSVQCSMVIII
jgi:hypothetical protein